MRTVSVIAFAVGLALGWGCFTPRGLEGFRAREVARNPAIGTLESAERVIGWADWFRAEPLPAIAAPILDAAGAGLAGWGTYELIDRIDGGGGSGDTYNITGNQGPVAIGGGSSARSSSSKQW